MNACWNVRCKDERVALRGGEANEMNTSSAQPQVRRDAGKLVLSQRGFASVERELIVVSFDAGRIPQSIIQAMQVLNGRILVDFANVFAAHFHAPDGQNVLLPFGFDGHVITLRQGSGTQTATCGRQTGGHDVSTLHTRHNKASHERSGHKSDGMSSRSRPLSLLKKELH
jgi:hypothetical protein